MSLRDRKIRAALAAALVLASSPMVARAETSVPLELQVELLQKVIRFERGFAERGGGEVRVVVVVAADVPESRRAAAQLEKLLARAGDMAGKRVRVIEHPWRGPEALKTAVVQDAAQLVYLTPGLASEIGGIASALSGVPAITVSTEGESADSGAILAFALVSGRPRVALNLGQARRQNLDFNSDLFRLARVIR